MPAPQNNPKKSYTTTVIFIVIIVASFLFYTYFVRNSGGTDDGSALSGETSAQSVPGRELFNLLDKLDAIKLDNGIFSDSRFKNLNDFSQRINPEPTGRTNPFSPIGSN